MRKNQANGSIGVAKAVTTEQNVLKLFGALIERYISSAPTIPQAVLTDEKIIC